MPVRRFRLGSSWEYPDSGDRSFRSYLGSATRRPGFWVFIVVAVLFAIAAYRSRLGFVITTAIYIGALAVLLAVGYVVWRRAGRTVR
jgi:hypothetical protein